MTENKSLAIECPRCGGTTIPTGYVNENVLKAKDQELSIAQKEIERLKNIVDPEKDFADYIHIDEHIAALSKISRLEGALKKLVKYDEQLKMNEIHKTMKEG